MHTHNEHAHFDLKKKRTFEIFASFEEHAKISKKNINKCTFVNTDSCIHAHTQSLTLVHSHSNLQRELKILNIYLFVYLYNCFFSKIKSKIATKILMKLKHFHKLLLFSFLLFIRFAMMIISYITLSTSSAF